MNKSKIKILFVMTSFGAGGAEKVCISLANKLIENKNFDISIVYFQDVTTLKSSLDTAVNTKLLECSRLIYSIPKLYSYLKKNSPDYIFANIWPITSISIFCNLLNNNNAHVITVEHSILQEDLKDKSYIFKIFANCSIRYLYPFAKDNLAVSEASKNDLQKRSNTNVKVIYNPVEEPKGKYPRPNDFREWFESEGLKMVSIGTLKKQKNFLLQIEACKELKNLGFKFTHLIIGEGPERKNLQKLIDEYSLNQEVFLIGFQSNPYVFLQHANLFVLTSDFEAFGNVIVEALHAGLRIIAKNDNSGVGEILKYGKYGKLFYGNDPKKLSSLIIEESKGTPKENLKKRALDFSPNQIIKKYLGLIDS